MALLIVSSDQKEKVDCISLTDCAQYIPSRSLLDIAIQNSNCNSITDSLRPISHASAGLGLGAFGSFRVKYGFAGMVEDET